LAKAVFLAGWVGQLAYSQMFFDGHRHAPSDLTISAIAYYLYLYLNFSGYCDVAIGLAGLAGISVPENFKNPLLARNLKEFWNRWHITLSEWMRDLVFSPMAKNLVGRVGPKYANHAIAGIILFVFLLIGVWHGKGWTFFIYGLLHGLGVVVNHYYTLALKKHMSREQYLSYMANRWIEAVGVLMTFLYTAVTLFFFANSFPQMKIILSSLK
jgi:D-alanyl-lipoteichoic acid acyltransferase DltB (MBOAT superfamily)